jgi:hypothetical protein
VAIRKIAFFLAANDPGYVGRVGNIALVLGDGDFLVSGPIFAPTFRFAILFEDRIPK